MNKNSQIIKLRHRTQSEVERPMLSISLTTFNHEFFIKDCLEGVLNQETDFPVEVLVYDDASKDRTQDFVKTYAALYPGIIKPIYQTENQFSRGVIVANEFNLKRARSDFIALCHGDDYWTEETKLQSQYQFMVKSGVGISGHPMQVLDENTGNLSGFTGYETRGDKVFPLNTLVRNNGNMLPYSSIMITSRTKDDLLEHMPPVALHTGIQMMGAMRYGLGVMKQTFGVYRVNVSGSTTEIMLGNQLARLNTTQRRLKSIQYISRLVNGKCFFSFRRLMAKQYLLLIENGTKFHEIRWLNDPNSKEFISILIIWVFMLLEILVNGLRYFKGRVVELKNKVQH